MEKDLGRIGISIQSVQHVNGSPYGQYWGYLVVQNKNEEPPIFFGRHREGPDQKVCDPFTSKRKAMKFAISLAGDMAENSEEHEACEFDHLWVDTGGEG